MCSVSGGVVAWGVRDRQRCSFARTAELGIVAPGIADGDQIAETAHAGSRDVVSAQPLPAVTLQLPEAEQQQGIVAALNGVLDPVERGLRGRDDRIGAQATALQVGGQAAGDAGAGRAGVALVRLHVAGQVLHQQRHVALIVVIPRSIRRHHRVVIGRRWRRRCACLELGVEPPQRVGRSHRRIIRPGLRGRICPGGLSLVEVGHAAGSVVGDPLLFPAEGAAARRFVSLPPAGRRQRCRSARRLSRLPTPAGCPASG